MAPPRQPRGQGYALIDILEEVIIVVLPISTPLFRNLGEIQLYESLRWQGLVGAHVFHHCDMIDLLPVLHPHSMIYFFLFFLKWGQWYLFAGYAPTLRNLKPLHVSLRISVWRNSINPFQSGSRRASDMTIGSVHPLHPN